MIFKTEENTIRKRGIESREELIKGLINYVQNIPISDESISPINRFSYNNQWHVRTSWLSRHYMTKIERMGLIERAGSYSEIMGETGQKGKAIFYRIIDNEVNNLITKLIK